LDNLITGIQITLLGMASVFLILLVLYFVLNLMRLVFQSPEEQSKQSEPKPAAQEPEPATQSQEGPAGDPKLLAAMAGALAAYQEETRPAGLLQIKEKAGPANLAWRQAARLEGTHSWRH
jgi:sodium pump decarboxylase gamma subunit